MPYNSSTAGEIARLMSDRGRIAADSLARRGAMRGQMISNIGRMASGTIADLARYRAEAPDRARRARLLEREAQQFRDEDDARGRSNAVRDVARLTTDPATGRIDTAKAAKEISLIDPAEGMKWWNQADAEQRASVEAYRASAQRISQWAGALRGVAPPQRPALYTEGRNTLIAEKVATADQIPEEFDESWLTKTHLQALSIEKQLEALAPKEPKTRTITSTKADGTKVEEIVEDVVGTTRESAPAAPENIDRAIFEAYRTKNFPEYRRLLGVKTEMSSAGREPDKPPTSFAPTAQQRADAEWQKQQGLRALEKEFTESMGAITKAQLDERKLAIENRYRVKIGLEPFTELPAGWSGAAGSPRNEPNQPAAPAAAPGRGRGAGPVGGAASPDTSVTIAELEAVAARRGTTIEQEKARATAEGFVVVR